MHVIGRNIGNEDALLLQRALAHQSFAGMKFVSQVLALVVSVSAQQPHHWLSVVAGVYIENTLLRCDQWRQFGQHHLRDCFHIALALQHSRETGKISLQPILLRVFLGRIFEIQNHLVDIIFECRDFTLRFHGDRSR